MTGALPETEGKAEPIRRVLDRLTKITRHGDTWTARCPAHDDKTPSLAVSVGSDGRALLKCHAGCTFEAISSALGVAPRDLFPSGDRRNGLRPEITTTYDYVDASGGLLYQVVRYVPKDFKQRRPDGKGGWVWSLKGVARVLYRLPQMLEAIQAGRRILIVEGEKDADALAKLGFAATTNAQGAGKWQRAFAAVCTGARVALIPDNDDAGRQHMQTIAASLAGLATEVRIVDLPGLEPKEDVSDWLADGHTADDLTDLVRHTPAWASPAPPPSEAAEKGPAGEPRHLTGMGNCERLVGRHHLNVRFVYAWRKWLVWDGRRFRRDDSGEMMRLAKETVASIYAEAAAGETDERRKAVAVWAARSESERHLREMISLAECELPVRLEELDANPWQLTVENGTVFLRTGEKVSSSRNDLNTKLAAVPFVEHAVAPTWLAFLDRILAGDQELIAFLQRAVGYSLTGDTREQVFFFLYGTGSNGKSTFLELLGDLLGDYAQQADFTAFLERRGEGPRNDIARLQGARFIASIEASEGHRLAEGLVKQLTGGDTIAARFLHAEFFEFRPQFKLWLAANHKPVIRGTDHAMWRRIRLIPFTVTIPEAEWDRELPAKLRAELPGILRWAIEGCLAWQREGLGTPPAVREATEAYRSEMDSLAAFLEECCEVGADAREEATPLFLAYKGWSARAGEHGGSQRAFGSKLAERGFTSVRGGRNGRAVWHGVRLLMELRDADPYSGNPPLSYSREGENGEKGQQGSVGSEEYTERLALQGIGVADVCGAGAVGE